MFWRLIPLGSDIHNLTLDLNRKVVPVTAEWRDIFIVDHPPRIKRDPTSSLCSPLHSIQPAPPFRIPHWLIDRLTYIGWELAPLCVVESGGISGKQLLVKAGFRSTTATSHWGSFLVILGTCTEIPGTPVHWAKVSRHYDSLTSNEKEPHDCTKDHIKAWPDWTRTFRDGEQIYRLSFSSCKLTPEHTLVFHLELEGQEYDKVKKMKNLELPSRKALELRPNVIVPSAPPSQPSPTSNAETLVSSPHSQPIRAVFSSIPSHPTQHAAGPRPALIAISAAPSLLPTNTIASGPSHSPINRQNGRNRRSFYIFATIKCLWRKARAMNINHSRSR